ncbi:hypothetical protein B0H10DRAFT_1953289 [Mycena sp. CBHHK59/15]|nr:hypothetical protein B0H10DRAFT_1953289 [Mycena sp. CBHHK59/15]
MLAPPPASPVALHASSLLLPLSHPVRGTGRQIASLHVRAPTEHIFWGFGLQQILVTVPVSPPASDLLKRTNKTRELPYLAHVTRAKSSHGMHNGPAFITSTQKYICRVSPLSRYGIGVSGAGHEHNMDMLSF